MGDKNRYNSLLPYLHPESSHYLRLAISLKSDESHILEKIASPFVQVDGSNPFAHIIQGSFVTDASSPVREVFLLIQRARPMLPQDVLKPLCNPDITRLWQDSFEAHLSLEGSGMLRFSCQEGAEGKLSPLAPLLFCKETKLFFHPPCPQCGKELEQCEDDELLASHHLPSFSSTQYRYLYCHHCIEEGKKPQFYTQSREDEDPLVVADINDLVSEFVRLLDSPDLAPGFPCPGCPQKQDCYGTSPKADKRIAPLSFFPFFMLAFEAPTMHLADFLPLLSGASKTEVIGALEKRNQLGRLTAVESFFKDDKAGFAFINRGQGRFLEILFLKSALFRQILDLLDLYNLQVRLPGLAPRINSLWVRLPDQDGLLPSFWDFKVQPVGLPLEPSKLSYAEKFNPPDEASCVALLWSYIFLTNKEQDIERVLDAAFALIQSEAQEQLPSSFAPQNLFWNPKEAPDLADEFRGYWKKVVDLGVSAFKAWQGEQEPWSMGEFKGKVEELAEKVKNSLFEAGPVTAPITPLEEETRELNQMAARVLEEIVSEWRMELEEEKETEKTMVEPPPQRIPQEEPPLQQTIIVSPESQAAESPAQPEAPERREKQVPLQETIIVSPGTPLPHEPKEATPPKPSPPPPEPEVPETIIISDLHMSKTPTQKKPKKEDLDKEFEETLSMLDQELLGKKKEEESPKEKQPLPKRIAEDSDIPETIIITPDKKPPIKGK